MAEEFSVRKDEVDRLISDLAQIRAALDRDGLGVRDVFTGSAKVDDALNRFFDQSTDYRKAMNGLLERTAGQFNELMAGAKALDLFLADREGRR